MTEFDSKALLRERVAKLERTFRHTHHAGRELADLDTYRKCGLDIRDLIHAAQTPGAEPRKGGETP